MNNFIDNIGVFNVTNKLNPKRRYPIILGSSSPRRIELLKEITKDFKIIKPNINEKKFFYNPLMII